jgi:hypothetical protein
MSERQIGYIVYWAAIFVPLIAVIAQLITITRVFFLSKRQPKLKVIRAKAYLYAAIISNISWQLMKLYQMWFGKNDTNTMIISYATDAIGFASLMLIWLLEIEAWRYNVLFYLTPKCLCCPLSNRTSSKTHPIRKDFRNWFVSGLVSKYFPQSLCSYKWKTRLPRVLQYFIYHLPYSSSTF